MNAESRGNTNHNSDPDSFIDFVKVEPSEVSYIYFVDIPRM